MDYFELCLDGWTAADFRYTSTRQDWAKRLGISEKTLSRYEKEIIDGVTENNDKILQVLYWRDRQGRHKLDYYQKTILWIITMLCFGRAYPDEKLTYCKVQEWFLELDKNTGKKRIHSITPKLVKERLGIA